MHLALRFAAGCQSQSIVEELLWNAVLKSSNICWQAKPCAEAVIQTRISDQINTCGIVCTRVVSDGGNLQLLGLGMEGLEL